MPMPVASRIRDLDVRYVISEYARSRKAVGTAGPEGRRIHRQFMVQQTAENLITRANAGLQKIHHCALGNRLWRHNRLTHEPDRDHRGQQQHQTEPDQTLRGANSVGDPAEAGHTGHGGCH